jgi:hypothetical protein
MCNRKANDNEMQDFITAAIVLLLRTKLPAYNCAAAFDVVRLTAQQAHRLK